MLTVLWLLADWMMKAPRLLAWMPVSADVLLYGLSADGDCGGGYAAAEAILLWTERDMEEVEVTPAISGQPG